MSIQAVPSTIAEHIARVTEVDSLPPVELPLERCDGLIVAADVYAKLPVPAFDNSAMDGFAVAAESLRSDEETVRLQVHQDIPAGISPESLAPGTACRIMTGAALPAGADTVIPVEDTDSSPGPRPLPATVELPANREPGAFVRRCGADVAKGDLLLRRGERLDPAALAAAASGGWGALRVVPRPRVAIVSTGAELATPGTIPPPGHIPDSNTVLLTTLVRRWGGDPVAVRVDKDEAQEVGRTLAEIAESADLIITSGGISAGAFDPLKELATTEGGSELRFFRLRQQPGGPQAWGSIAGTPYIGLPGNPVSVFVSGLLYAQPTIALLGGAHGAQADRLRREPVTVPATAGADFPRLANRRRYVPVRLNEGVATPVHADRSASHLIASLHLANALLLVEEGTQHERVMTQGTRGRAIIL
ncbi:MAG: molybdopterin molybdotransferase MoeA [Flaviflexus sp.]|nr:molybdopterin molybdotransferase MoeA [Flaviflexus sp.]